jgi:hypothetical protein
MLTLSDDEATEADGALPQGLRFHLSRCPSCRALADRLQSVSHTIGKISQLDPGEDLLADANARALRALKEGANLTGRVAIPDEPEHLAGTPRTLQLAWWVRWGSYAAAAAIVFGFGLYGLTMLVARDGRQTAADVTPLEGHRRAAPHAPVSKDPRLASEGVTAPDGEPDEAAEEAVSGDQGQRLADRTGRDRRTRRAYSYGSVVEQAACDSPDCVYRATVLPDSRQRDLGWGNALFDRRRHTMSTTRRDRGD